MPLLSPDVGEKVAGLQVLGNVARPGYAFQADPSTGFILDAPGRIGVVASGVLVALLPDDLTTTEEIQDVVGAMLQDASGVTWTYSDAAGTIAPAVDHGGLGGLADDDHTTYVLLAGRAAAPNVGASGLRYGTFFGTDLDISDQLLVSGTGSHAIGRASAGSAGLAVLLSATAAGASATGAGFGEGTLSAAANADLLRHFRIGGDNTWARGTFTGLEAVQLIVEPPSSVTGTGTITNASTLKISAAPSAGTNNYALWVDAGAVRLDGLVDIGSGGTVPTGQLLVDQASTTAAIPVISLEQRDIDQDWFEFDTTIGTGNATEAAGAKTLTTTHFLAVTITGVGVRYLPVGTIA